MKINRKEIDELAALTIKNIKTTRPDLSDKEVRVILSQAYRKLKGAK